MQNQTQTLRKRMRGGKYEKWDRGENAKYKIEFRVKKGRIVYIKAARRIYPLKRYGNYEELNIELTLLRKNAYVKVYYLRNSWNGSGYFPVCQEKIPHNVFDDIIYDIHGNIKNIVLNIFEAVGNYFKNTEKCPGAVWVLFPPPS